MIYRDRKKISEAICRILLVYSLKQMRFCYSKKIILTAGSTGTTVQYRVIQ